MQNGQFLFTILGSLLAIIAICNIDKKKSVEGFWNGIAFTHTAVPIAKNLSNTRGSSLPGMSASPLPTMRSATSFSSVSAPKMMQNNGASQQNWGTPLMATTIQDLPQSSFFKPGPNLQTQVPPRMSGSMNAGALIRYNTPDTPNMAFDSQNPIVGGCGVKNNVSEGYCASGGCASDVGGVSGPKCGTGGLGPSKVGQDALLPNPSYANGNYADVLGQIPFQVITDEVPVGEMNNELQDGSMEQVVVYDQFMVANLKGRLSQGQDMIRGAVPVSATKYGNFDVFPTISEIPQGGAMAMFGEGAVDKQSLHLYSAAKGGNLSHYAGGTLSKPIVQTAQNMASATAGGSDVANSPNVFVSGYI